MTILFILNFILLSVGLILIYKAKQIKVQKTNQINRIQQQVDRQCSILTELQKQKDSFQILIEDKKRYLNILQEACDRTKNDLKEKQNNLDQQYELLKEQSIKSFEQYSDVLDKSYISKEKQVINKIKELQKSREQAENQLAQIKSIYQAATAARLREKQDQEKRKFYQLQIPPKQVADIQTLKSWKQNLNDPSIVSKVIWSSYIMKPTSDLCNRVVGSSTVCGIYKITNISSGDIYIGQSVNITDRFKQHIKCGLGIDAPATNKLYNNMQEWGVWNFTFEILQKCSRDQLNEKERFWIEMYQSNEVGLNVTKGNK